MLTWSRVPSPHFHVRNEGLCPMHEGGQHAAKSISMSGSWYDCEKQLTACLLMTSFTRSRTSGFNPATAAASGMGQKRRSMASSSGLKYES